MPLLSIELSTPRAGLALFDDAGNIATDTWPQGPGQRALLHERLPALLSRAGTGRDQINPYVIGLGPGSFAGIRNAIATAQGLALPGAAAVGGIPSGEAIAWDATEETGRSCVCALGDARRGRLWYGIFAREADRLVPQSPFALIPPEALAERLPPEAVVVTSDWERLADRLPPLLPGACRLLEGPRLPDAATLARLAIARLERGQALDSPIPLYLHPAVFVKPRFPARRS